MKDIVVFSELIQIPGNTTNKLYDPFNNLYWIRNLSLIGQHQWSIVANATYSEPIWNETIGTYTWPNGLTQNDYPAFRECSNLELDGYTDWRMPSIQELDNFGGNISWNFVGYGFTNFIGWTCSATEDLDLRSQAFCIFLDISDILSVDKTNIADIICVRQD